MDIAFLGGLFPKDQESDIVKLSKHGIQFAANNLQWGILTGLDANNNEPVHICNIMFVGSFPFGYRQLFIRTKRFSHCKRSNDINLGFFNLIGVSMIFRFLSATMGLINWARRSNNKKVIIIYSLHTPFLLAAIIIRRLYPKIRLSVIVPDLPEFMSDSSNRLYQLLKTIDRRVIDFCISRIEAFALVSDCMIERIDIGLRPWARIEGIFNKDEYKFHEEKSTEKVIMYSGNLNVMQGIVELLDSFSLIENSNYRLWITGSGDGLKTVLKRAENDSRIKYWPKLNQNDLFKLLQLSTVLINPMNPVSKKSRFFFPSKTMEYMASGTPTIMFKLPCMPEEYQNYLYYFNNPSIKGMRDRIVEICEKPRSELFYFGKKAQTFILNEKYPENQCHSFFSILQNLFNP